VAGTIVAVELVGLAVPLELDLVLVHLFRARCAILVAEQAEQRAAEILSHVDRRNGRLGIELLLAHDHAATPQVGASIDVLPLASIDEGVPAARAGAEKTNLAVVIGLHTHPLQGAFGIATVCRRTLPAPRCGLGGMEVSARLPVVFRDSKAAIPDSGTLSRTDAGPDPRE
jgi:hypothetical protein